MMHITQPSELANNTIKVAQSTIQEAATKHQSAYNDLLSKAKDIWSRLHILHCIILIGTPIMAVWAFFNVEIQFKTAILSVIWYWITGLGITMGYHRLYAHRAFQVVGTIPQLILIFMGTGAMQGSIKWWAGGHRVHHRYTDTKFDPYDSTSEYGLWYSHFGWMLVHPRKENHKYADISDLNNNKWVRLQHKHYLWLGPFISLVFPTLIAGLGWGDWMGGYFYAGVARQVLVHHSTFCVNSIAHYLGEANFDDERTPRDSLITAFLTFGEGFHNFHHEFPNDYRNGINTWDYDPTKWLIQAWHKLGWATGLKTFPKNQIDMGVHRMRLKQLEELSKRIQFPIEISELPEMSVADVKQTIKDKGLQLTIINNVVYDVSCFINEHPGGKTYIKSIVGADGTERFFGLTGVYKHSTAAHNLLAGFRYARIIESEHKPVVPMITNKQHEDVIPNTPKTD